MTNEVISGNIKKAIEKYMHEPKFHALVDAFENSLVVEFISSTDLKLVLDLAICKYNFRKRMY